MNLNDYNQFLEYTNSFYDYREEVEMEIKILFGKICSTVCLKCVQAGIPESFLPHYYNRPTTVKLCDDGMSIDLYVFKLTEKDIYLGSFKITDEWFSDHGIDKLATNVIYGIKIQYDSHKNNKDEISSLYQRLRELGENV